MICRDGQGYPCKNKVTGWIVAPDGDDVPGGWSCEYHANLVVSEYAEKLGEKWAFRPLIKKEAV